MGIREFDFERSRGIVWVCDVVRSSRFLNDNQAVSSLEEFLPRLYWTSVATVEAAGGQFIKWTGDGFLAWFPVSLHRQIPEEGLKVFHAAYFITTLINITQLGVHGNQKFKVRHGICLEHDALLIKIKHQDHESLDLIGRAVVLAFRLSGLPTDFPGIATKKDLLHEDIPPKAFSWKRKILTKEERLKYFKGEGFGLRDIYVSVNKIRKQKPVKSLIKSITRTLSEFNSQHSISTDSFGGKLVPLMLNGPEWCQNIMKEYGQHASRMHELLSEALDLFKAGHIKT
jgi:hypothetical protein